MGERVFLITGASSGIGEATARRAVEAGHRVVLVARSATKLQSLAAQLGDADRALPVAADVTEYGDMEHAVERALDVFGRVDVVVANAGIREAHGFKASTPDRWRQMILTNVLGTALTIRATYDALVDAKGHLLVMGSVAGRRHVAGSLYSCTKWATAAMTEAIRLELINSGVRVTLVAPGVTDTALWTARPDACLEPEDVAHAVLYAVSQPPHVAVGEILVRPAVESALVPSEIRPALTPTRRRAARTPRAGTPTRDGA